MADRLTVELCSKVYDLAHDTPESELLGAMASYLRMAAERIGERMIESGRCYPAVPGTPMYVSFAKKQKSWRTEEVLPGRVLVDFDGDGTIIGVEILSTEPPVSG